MVANKAGVKGALFLLTWFSLAASGLLHAQEPSPLPKVIDISTGEWPPFTSERPNRHRIGLIIVEQAFLSQGISVNFTFMPWKRAYRDAKKGAYLATGIWLKDRQRQKDFVFSDPVITDEIVFFHLKTLTLHYSTLKDIQHLRIAINSGYSYGDELNALIQQKKINVVKTATPEQSFKQILLNRADTHPVSKLNGLYILKDSFLPKEHAQFTFQAKPLQQYTAHLLISKTLSPTLAKQIETLFNKGLAQFKETQQYKNLFNDNIPNQL